LAFDPAGNLYVGNYSNSTIEKLSPTGTDLGAFASGPPLNNPQALAFDDEGNLFASNFGDATIAKLDPSAVGTIYSNSPLLGGPTGLAFDHAGNLFSNSSSANAVVKLDSLGGGVNFATGFSTPFGAVFDSRGNLYVANQGNNTIRKIDPAGNATLFANAGLNSPILMALRQTSPIVPALKIGSANRPANNHFIISGQALPNALVTIYATTNLANGFTKLGTTTADNTGAYQFDDSTAIGQPARIYRAIYP
jgi:DNA-binding beta-propeller fold protein YncE